MAKKIYKAQQPITGVPKIYDTIIWRCIKLVQVTHMRMWIKIILAD